MKWKLLDNMVKAVRKLAADNPDFIYEPPVRENTLEGPSCSYFMDKYGIGQATHGCIMGRALAMLNISPDTDAKQIHRHLETRQPANYQLTQEDFDKLGWLQIVQQYQDNSIAWEQSIKLADIDQPLT